MRQPDEVTASGELERAGGIRLLLVSADPTVRRQLPEVLARIDPIGFEVSEAEDVTQAIVDGRAFDVLVLDLPALDAAALADVERIRGAHRSCGLLVLTPPDLPGAGVTAVRAGADDHLPRTGLEQATLERAIRYAVDRAHVAREARVAQRLEALGRLAGAVSHVFNNALMEIHASVSFAADSSAEAATREELGAALDAVERATALTHRLVAFGAREPREPVTCDLDALLREEAHRLGAGMGEAHRLVVQLPEEPACVSCDPRQLLGALRRVLDNARQASPGGCVSLDVRPVTLVETLRRGGQTVRPGEYVRIAIADEGRGLTRESLERVFEPFFTSEDGGTRGLGLSIVYGIVRQSGGAVTLESEVGRGTRVKIYLPRVTACACPGAADAPPLSGIRVLLVDDDARLRRLSAEGLRRAGAEVTQAANGFEALAALRDGLSVDVLVTDLVMPGLTGQELAARIGALRPEVTPVFVTGYTSYGEVLGGELLHKPFSRRALIDAVRRASAPSRSGALAS